MEIGLENIKFLGLAFAILGIASLAFLLPEEKYGSLGSISEKNIGENIGLIGIVRNIEFRNANAFFTLENNGTIKAVYFKPKTEQILLLKNGAMLRVFGQISYYEGELEIIAEKVTGID